ncbi:MAG: hypothetical protein QW478_11695 [Candidatus Micrarchaeaceae archaeon]
MSKTKQSIKKIISKGNKIKNEQQREQYFLSYSICPICLTQTIKREEGEVYCKNCGTVFDTEIEYTHGYTKEDGDRVEIYTPPTNSSEKSSSYAGFNLDKNIPFEKRELFKRLHRVAKYVSAKYSENPHLYKTLKRIISLLNLSQAVGNKKILLETAMREYRNQQEKTKNNKTKADRINPYTILIKALYKQHIYVDKKTLMSILYATNSALKSTKLVSFKKNISKNMMKLSKTYTPEELIEYKKHVIQQVFHGAKIPLSEELVNEAYSIFTDLIKFNPNIGIEDAMNKLILKLKLEKRIEDLTKEMNSERKAGNEKWISLRTKINLLNKKLITVNNILKNINSILKRHPKFKI